MRRKYKQYTDEDMHFAAQAILNKTHNIRQASLEFQIPISTLKATLRKIRQHFQNSQPLPQPISEISFE